MPILLHVHCDPQWSIDEMDLCCDIRRFPFSLQAVDVLEATHRTAAFIQSWLYWGILQSILSRLIPTSYMMQSSSDGKAWLNGRTLLHLQHT